MNCWWSFFVTPMACCRLSRRVMYILYSLTALLPWRIITELWLCLYYRIPLYGLFSLCGHAWIGLPCWESGHWMKWHWKLHPLRRYSVNRAIPKTETEQWKAPFFWGYSDVYCLSRVNQSKAFVQTVNTITWRRIQTRLCVVVHTCTCMVFTSQLLDFCLFSCRLLNI